MFSDRLLWITCGIFTKFSRIRGISIRFAYSSHSCQSQRRKPEEARSPRISSTGPWNNTERTPRFVWRSPGLRPLSKAARGGPLWPWKVRAQECPGETVLWLAFTLKYQGTQLAAAGLSSSKSSKAYAVNKMCWELEAGEGRPRIRINKRKMSSFTWNKSQVGYKVLFLVWLIIHLQ